MTSPPLTPELQRPPKHPVIASFQAILSTLLPTGDGRAPECDGYPYLIVASPPPSTFDGSMLKPDADGLWRVSVVAVGQTQTQAILALDRTRQYLTLLNVRATWPAETGYKAINVRLDVSRGTMKEERGLPEPLHSDVDFYVVMVTPNLDDLPVP